MTRQQRPQYGFVAVQDHVHAGVLSQRIDKTGNNRCRPTVATHGVNRNDYAVKGRGRRRLGSGGHGI
jgi:hypothetical protein